MVSKLSNTVSSITLDICEMPSLSVITKRRARLPQWSCHLSEAFSNSAVPTIFEKRNVDLFCTVSPITTLTSKTFSVHFLSLKQ